jgi:nucleoside-diphosphate-sugar epimerase
MGSSSDCRLVIFGCGYVGTAVARDALSRGWRVTALTRNAAKASVLRDEGVETVVADLATNAWHEHVPGAPAFVLNCVSSGGGGVDGYRRSYLDGMRSIAEWAMSRGPAGTFVYTSSTSVYPQGGGALVDETAPTTNAGERGQILLAAEDVVRSANHLNGGAVPPPRSARQAGTSDTLAGGGTRPPLCWHRWFILRLAGIYGPQRQHLIEQVRGGEVAGVGTHRLNLIHRDDIVAAIRACFEAPATVANEIFNVADDGAAAREEIVAWLANRMAVPNPRFTGLPAGERRSVTPDRVILNSKLKSRLGWRPGYSTFREGYASLLSR